MSDLPERPRRNRPDAAAIAAHQRAVADEDFRDAVRALLLEPLMTPSHRAFALVRRHSDDLKTWFQREAGWRLDVERDGARLYKRPGEATSSVRGFRDYDRRRYVVFCLTCAVLERADAQITLRLLGEQLLTLATAPELAAAGFTLTLTTQGERRDLVAVCRTLLTLGILSLVAGDEEGYLRGGDQRGDALYDVRRPLLAGLLAASRGPSTFTPEAMPGTTDTRVAAIIEEAAIDSDDGRRTAIRHRLARRLLDDPVVYVADLAEDERSYYVNQRGPLAARLGEAAGLVVEQRAEGLALVDPDGELTDVRMPSEGTDPHVTLLVAEMLAGRLRNATPGTVVDAKTDDIAAYLRKARRTYGKYWRKSALEPGAEVDLAATAIAWLESLHLVSVSGDHVTALPALARFALADLDIAEAPTRPAPRPRQLILAGTG